MISKLHAWFVIYTELEKGWGVRAGRSRGPSAPCRPIGRPRSCTTCTRARSPRRCTTRIRSPASPSMRHRQWRRRAPAHRSASSPRGWRVSRMRAPSSTCRTPTATTSTAGSGMTSPRSSRTTAASRSRSAACTRARARVRQFLDVFGPQGLHQGELFDHLQYQPVVHVVGRWPDRQGARARVQHGGPLRRRCQHRWRHLRERLREGERRLEDPPPAFLHDLRRGSGARLGERAAACGRCLVGSAAGPAAFSAVSVLSAVYAASDPLSESRDRAAR